MPRWLDTLLDLVGPEYHTVTDVFAPEFTRMVGGWPRVVVLPGEGNAEVMDAAQVVANLLRRDLGMAGPISVVGIEETPSVTLESWFASVQEDPLVFGDWQGTVSLGLVRAAGRLRLHGVVFRPGATDAPARVSCEGPEDDVGRLGVEYADLVARALQLEPTARTREAWRRARPTSYRAVEAVGAAWRRQDALAIERGLAARELHADAASWLDDEAPDRGPGTRALAHGLAQDPLNAQLAFLHYCFVDDGKGRRRSVTRALARALESSPGHGKAQMVFAHCFENRPGAAARILAHAETGWRLLPNNPYAACNLSGYLAQHSPTPEHGPALMSELLARFPNHPVLLENAPAVFFPAKQYEAGLRAADLFLELVTPPVHAETERWLSDDLKAKLASNPQAAVEHARPWHAQVHALAAKAKAH